MESFGGRADTGFSPNRRTAAVLVGDGTSSAYLAGVVSALRDAGVRIDVVVGKGAGAFVAALSAIDAESSLLGEDGLFARLAGRRPWRLRPLYKMTLACLTISFAAFLSPALLGIVALIALPLQALGRLLSGASEPSRGAGWVVSAFESSEPIYFRAMVVPLIVLCAVWLGWWAFRFLRERRAPALPEVFDLDPLTTLLESTLWQAVRGASTADRPRDRAELADAHRKLLTGSLGQLGFRELLFYALDTDSGREVPFAILKERFFRRLSRDRVSSTDSNGVPAEALDLTKEEGSLLFDTLLAALSPPGLVPSVPVKLPLGTPHGGEVHRFSSSLLVGGSALLDAVAAGAEQIVYIAGCAPGDRPSGNAWERLVEAATRKTLADDLAEAARVPDLPVFLIRPDKLRLSPYEITGRMQLGNERLDLAALTAHGRRDAHRLFIEPIFGDERGDVGGEATIPIRDEGSRAGPHEL